LPTCPDNNRSDNTDNARPDSRDNATPCSKISHIPTDKIFTEFETVKKGLEEIMLN